MLNAMREGLRLDYEGKGLLSFVSNERGSQGGDNNARGLAERCLLTSVKPTRAKPVRKRCSFIPANCIYGLEQNGEVAEKGRKHNDLKIVRWSLPVVPTLVTITASKHFQRRLRTNSPAEKARLDTFSGCLTAPRSQYEPKHFLPHTQCARLVGSDTYLLHDYLANFFP